MIVLLAGLTFSQSLKGDKCKVSMPRSHSYENKRLKLNLAGDTMEALLLKLCDCYTLTLSACLHQMCCEISDLVLVFKDRES